MLIAYILFELLILVAAIVGIIYFIGVRKREKREEKDILNRKDL